jgi:hypothetical protein
MKGTRQPDHFLKGPIPWWWIERAATLPSRALVVGLVIWLWAGMRKTDTIRLSSRHVLPTMGISRFVLYRALSALEDNSLVRVKRRRGHPPMVTLVKHVPVKRSYPAAVACPHSARRNQC